MLGIRLTGPEAADSTDPGGVGSRRTDPDPTGVTTRVDGIATRGPYAKGTLKRQEILRVALEAVAQHGYRRTYISEIAQRVGLTQAGLIHHFRTREQLYEEIIRTRDEHDRDTFANAPHGLEGFFAVIEHNQHVPGLVQLYAEFSAEASHPGHPAHAFFRERYAYLREALVRDIELARVDGEFGDGVDPETAAELLISSADGLQLQWLIDRRIDMVARLRELWRGLCAASMTGGGARPNGAVRAPRMLN